MTSDRPTHTDHPQPAQSEHPNLNLLDQCIVQGTVVSHDKPIPKPPPGHKDSSGVETGGIPLPPGTHIGTELVVGPCPYPPNHRKR